MLGLLSALIAGCNSQVEDYVKSKKPEFYNNPPASPDTISSPMSLKLTPGKFNGSAADMALQGTVTVTNESFALGGDRAISLTINRTRVRPQINE